MRAELCDQENIMQTANLSRMFLWVAAPEINTEWTLASTDELPPHQAGVG